MSQAITIHRYFRAPFWGMIVFLGFIASACTSQSPESSLDNSVPTDFKVVFGSGGGFTGLWQGHIIDASGTIFTWRGQKPGEHPKKIGRVPASAVQQLWKKIRDQNVLSLQHLKAGNLSQFLSVTANGKTHSVSWGIESPDRQPPAPLAGIIVFCDSLVTKGTGSYP